MKNSTKLFLGAVSLAGVCSAAAPAFAQDASPWALSGSVALTSDYKFRGISQNDRDFAPQGSVTLTGPEGFYVSAWASQVDFDPTSSGNPHVELDIYGGKHTDLWGVDWNFMPYYYAYPSENYGTGPTASYFELINQFTKSFGPLTLSGSWAWSDNLAFNGGTGNALYGTASYTILDWLSVSGTIGHQWAQNAKYAGSSDYTYGDIGATATWKGFALDLRYNGTDLNTAQCAAFYMATTHACAGNFIATLSYTVSLLP
ncbi:MAG TPA: TorF family putative porin [Rhizomicrobium sp.]|nr:TorF family putative porin [Rhizomicrobium sp.]